MKFNFKQILFVIVAILFVACGPDGGGIEQPVDNKPDKDLDTTIQFALQYCEDTILTALGQEYSETVFEQSAAIKLTEAQLNAFVLNRIIKMSVGLHGQDKNSVSTQYSGLKFWIREELNGEDLWSQEFTGDINLMSWNEMILSPYFKIKEPVYDLYIGYTIHANGLIIGCDGSQTPVKDGCYIYDCASKRWIQHTEMGNMCVKCVVSGENMPQNDAALVAIETAEYAKPNVGYTFVATIANISLNILAICSSDTDPDVSIATTILIILSSILPDKSNLSGCLLLSLVLVFLFPATIVPTYFLSICFQESVAGEFIFSI